MLGLRLLPKYGVRKAAPKFEVNKLYNQMLEHTRNYDRDAFVDAQAGITRLINWKDPYDYLRLLYNKSLCDWQFRNFSDVETSLMNMESYVQFIHGEGTVDAQFRQSIKRRAAIMRGILRFLFRQDKLEDELRLLPERYTPLENEPDFGEELRVLRMQVRDQLLPRMLFFNFVKMLITVGRLEEAYKIIWENLNTLDSKSREQLPGISDLRVKSLVHLLYLKARLNKGAGTEESSSKVRNFLERVFREKPVGLGEIRNLDLGLFSQIVAENKAEFMTNNDKAKYFIHSQSLLCFQLEETIINKNPNLKPQVFGMIVSPLKQIQKAYLEASYLIDSRRTREGASKLKDEVIGIDGPPECDIFKARAFDILKIVQKKSSKEDQEQLEGEADMFRYMSSFEDKYSDYIYMDVEFRKMFGLENFQS